MSGGTRASASRYAGHALAWSLVLGLWIGLTRAGRARERAPLDRETPPAPPAVAWIDPGAARIAEAPPWADPRWLERVRSVVSTQAPFEVAHACDLGPLADALAALAFVERVVRLELDSEHLELELVLRRPIACIQTRAGYALLDENGVVLEGRWPSPPRLEGAFLPVLGPLSDRLLAAARDGDWLAEPEHLDGLDVARSMAENLSPAQRGALGRVLIDARAARDASAEEPGVRLELEGGRRALFGRASNTAAPGEVAPAKKWASLVRALELYQSEPLAGDWDLVDLRWDRPDLALRSAPLVARAERTENGPSGGVARDPLRPRVR